MTSHRLASVALSIVGVLGCSNLSVIAPDPPDAADGAVDTGLRDAQDASDITAADARDASDGRTDADAVADDADDADASTEDAPEDIADGEDVTVILSDVREMDVARDIPADFTLLDISSDASSAGSEPSRGGAIALTPDDRIAVAANRGADTVSVMLVAAGPSPTLTRTMEFPVGTDSEPWAVAIGPDGDSAYVILRRAQQVLRITSLHGTPTLSPMRGSTGSEPTGLALSPSGEHVYVANFADGTVSVLHGTTLAFERSIDLNAALVATGMLGPDVTARPALAHPRALVVSNNGNADDSDDFLYVTEFFGQRRLMGAPAGLERFDQDRLGVVYRVDLATNTPVVHTLAPVTDMGFRDNTNGVAGCFANQLHAIAINGGRVYVTAVCASPRGPTGLAIPAAATDAGTDAAVDVPRDVVTDVPADNPDAALVPDPDSANFRTEHATVVFVMDGATGDEIPAQRLVLNQRFQALFDTQRLADNGAVRRVPLIPIDIAFVPGTNTAYVVGYGSDAVFRVRYNSTGSVAEFGLTSVRNFIELNNVTPLNPGQNPIGVALSSSANNDAFVLNEHTRNVSAVSLATQAVTSVTTSAAMPTGTDATIAQGRRFFVTGTGRWSLRGQAWNSCEACHPDGLTDNVTWFFGRGPRQTPALDADFDKGSGTTQRILNWTAIFDEVADFELNTRGNSGGVGAIVHRANDGASPPQVTGADRIVFDGTSPTPPQVATADPRDGLRGAIGDIATSTGTGSPRSALDDWNAITRYVQTIRTTRAPTGLSASDVTAGRSIFLANHCDGCHGGRLWTIAERFYAPSDAFNGPTGTLSTRRFTRPTAFPSMVAPVDGTLRLTPFDAANDQIVCVLRNVGTYATGAGVAPTGVNILEVRANGRVGATTPMALQSQGANGFSPPSLLGLSTSAPYLHAGQARSLEELFSTTFRAHHQSFSPSFLTGASAATELRQLVAFLLSIDGDATTVSIPTSVGAGASGFNPNLCGM